MCRFGLLINCVPNTVFFSFCKASSFTALKAERISVHSGLSWSFRNLLNCVNGLQEVKCACVIFVVDGIYAHGGASVYSHVQRTFVEGIELDWLGVRIPAHFYYIGINPVLYAWLWACAHASFCAVIFQ